MEPLYLEVRKSLANLINLLIPGFRLAQVMTQALCMQLVRSEQVSFNFRVGYPDGPLKYINFRSFVAK